MTKCIQSFKILFQDGDTLKVLEYTSDTECFKHVDEFVRAGLRDSIKVIQRCEVESDITALAMLPHDN